MTTPIRNVAPKPPTDLDRKIAEALQPLINAVLGKPDETAITNKFTAPKGGDDPVEPLVNAKVTAKFTAPAGE